MWNTKLNTTCMTNLELNWGMDGVYGTRVRCRELVRYYSLFDMTTISDNDINNELNRRQQQHQIKQRQQPQRNIINRKKHRHHQQQRQWWQQHNDDDKKTIATTTKTTKPLKTTPHDNDYINTFFQCDPISNLFTTISFTKYGFWRCRSPISIYIHRPSNPLGCIPWKSPRYLYL